MTVENIPMRAALAGEKKCSIFDSAVSGMRSVGLLKEGQLLADASASDVLQVGRYIGELLHLSGHGTPADHWPEPVPRPQVAATPSEVGDMVALLEEALCSRGADGIGGPSSPHWRERAQGLIGAVKVPPQPSVVMRVDLSRRSLGIVTGIYVRAKEDDRWVSADIAQLDKASLRDFLRSGRNIAENVVGILLGHGHLDKDDP